MSLADPFAPLSDEEMSAPAAVVAKAEKVPIVPVPDDAPPCSFRHPAYGAPVKLWEYRDSLGHLYGYDARFECTVDGTLQKEVLPITFCNVGDKTAWRSKALPTPRPPYGLDRLAARRSAPVVVAEGAKAADAAGVLLPEYVAISWSGGANAIGQTSWSALKGRDVLIWPDRDRQCDADGAEKPYEDQPGTIAAENIVGRLRNTAGSIQVLRLESLDCADGWDADDALKEGWSPERARAFIEQYAITVDVETPGLVLPYNFEVATDGLYHIESESKRTKVCGRLKVLAKTRDAVGASWGLLLEWRDDDSRQHRWSMPKAMLAGDGSAVREALFERGLFVSTASTARARLLEFLSLVDTTVRARAVTKVGWSGGAFALPHITIGDTPTERVIFQNPDAGPHQYSSAGTLEEWQENVAKLAIGNSRVAFMFSAAFVGPLLSPACEEGGGVNFVGSSSCGKTSGLKGATSVWGSPTFMRTWRATGNGLEGVAVQHSETLLCLDELGQLEPREAGAVAYMLGNGQGKARAGRSGSSRAAATWNVMYLSTGEIGLADLAREGKSARTTQAGQEVRILDVPADAGRGMGMFERLNGADTPEAFSRLIKSAASNYYGTAAPAFIERLVPIRDALGDMVADIIARFTAAHVAPGSDGQVHRAARRFGLVAAAGEIAIALGVLPWPRNEALDAAGVMFAAWVDRRGGTGSAEDRNILAKLRSFVELHGASRFSSMIESDDGGHRLVLNRAGFFRQTTIGNAPVREYLFLPEAWKEIFAGFDIAHVNRLLVKQGVLHQDGAGKNSQSITLPEIGKTRCYVVSAAGFGDVD